MEKRTFRVHVGGVRKTCNSTKEGLPKIARVLAKFFIEERRDKLASALRCEPARMGYVLPARDSTAFSLSQDIAVLEQNISAALHVHVMKLEEKEGILPAHRPFGVDPLYMLS